MLNGAQDVLDALATMRSIRRYVREPVPDDDLAKILYAASRAPSPGNRQAARFVVLSQEGNGAKARRILGDAYRAGWNRKVEATGWWEGSGLDPSSRKSRAGRAMEEFVRDFETIPVVIVACTILSTDPRLKSPLPLNSQYEGCAVFPAVENLLIAARALGYGGTMSCWHEPVVEDLRAVLEVPAGVALSAIITLGKPVGNHGPLRRRSMSEIVYADTWCNPAPWAVDPPMSRILGKG